MAPRFRTLRLVAAATAAGVAVVASLRPRAEAAVASLRRSSSPSARLYDLVAGRILGGLYEQLAVDVTGVARELGATEALEIGPGPGDLAVRFARHAPTIRLTGVDLDPAMVALASAKAAGTGLSGRVRFIVGDVGALPFPGSSFDLVFSSFSAHHWPDDGAGYGEIRRVLRPSGRAIVFDIHDRWGRLETGAAALGRSAGKEGFLPADVSPVRWPGRLSIVNRIELRRA